MAAFQNSRTGWLIVALMGLLAGCAAGGGKPQPSTPPDTARQVAGAGGAPLAAVRWGPAKPVATIVALHGYGDHAQSTFSGPATYWAGRGLATVAYDQRGFGRNPSRGIWPGAGALIDDAAAVVAEVRASAPCQPVILLGHSMGGGVALAAVGEDRARVDGLVLAVPAIWGGASLNPLHRLVAWTAAAVTPDVRYSGRGVVRIQASDNIEALRALGRDPLYLSPPSAREIFGLVRITDRAEAVAARADVPALLLLGARDQIVPNRTVSQVFARLPGQTREILYPEGWHLLFRDLQARRVWTDVADWILTLPLPEGCPSG